MSKNSDKRQLGIDVISRIDDRIIKDATAERIKMLKRVERASSPLGKFLKYGSAVAAVFVVMLGVMLAVLLLNGKQIPVYNGMTVSGEMPIYSGDKESGEMSIPTLLPTLDITNYRNGQLARSMKAFVGIGRLDKDGIPNANGQGNGRPGQNPGESVYDSVDMTPGTGEPDVSESVSETEPDDLSPEPVNPIYYAKQNEDFYITVHIDNPDSFEILSFTLNGEKYSAYMFEEGSDLEHLVLKCNVENAEGIVEYTIDAIKYVDGTVIKDVRIKGDRTVKIGVWTSDQPYASFNVKNWQSHSLVLDVKIRDHKGMLALSDGRVYAYLYNGDKVYAAAEFVELDPNTPNRIVFYSMEPEKSYRLEIRARYDAFDGKGVSDYVLYSEVAMTAPSLVAEGDNTENYGELKYDLVWADDTTERRILSAEILKGNDMVKTLDVAADATEIVVDGLLSDMVYTLRLKYSCNGQEYSLQASAKTRIKQAPSINLGNVKRDRNSISGSVELNDPLGLASAFRMELWLGDELITTVNEMGDFVFDGLAVEKGYTVKYIVEYDADDGKGTVTNTTTRKYWYESEGLAYDTSGRISGIGTCTDTVLYLDTEIYRDAFAGNDRITKVYIGENVKKIGERAFKDCKSLTEVVLPDEMESLGANTFEGCPISEFNIPKLNNSNFNISAINNTNVKVLAIPEGVTVSGYLSVYSYEEYDELARELTLISFGSEDLFVDVRVYYYVNNPDSYGTWQLKAINIAGAKDTVREDGTIYAVYENGERVLIKAQDGTGTFRVPEGVIKICDNAFSYMRYNTVTLPSTLTEIGAYAFSSSALTEVIIPEGVTSIGESAFAECRSLQKVTIGEGLRKLENGTFNCCEKLCEISLPETLTSIGVVALNECHSLKLIVIPAGVTSIGEKGITGSGSDTIVCFKSSELPNIVRPQDYENIKFITDFKEFITDGQGVTYAVTNSGEMIATSYSGTSASVVLPEGVVEIASRCFANNNKLVSITLPSTLKKIGRAAFEGCERLYDVTLPEGLVEIGGYAFRCCYSIKSIKLPEGLTTIGEWAFQECNAIEKLIVPQGTAEIGNGAFWGVPMVYFRADTLPGELDPNDQSFTINFKEFMTDGQGVTYAVLNNGEMIAVSCDATGTSVVLPEGVVEIAARCFESETKLVSIKLPLTLRVIGELAFASCSSLASITIPEGVEEIPAGAFKYCSGLVEVVLPSTLKSINNEAFERCENLASITLPEGLEYIGNSAFLENRALTELLVPLSVEIIGEWAFTACYELTLYYPGEYIPYGWNVTDWGGRIVTGAEQN